VRRFSQWRRNLLIRFSKGFCQEHSRPAALAAGRSLAEIGAGLLEGEDLKKVILGAFAALLVWLVAPSAEAATILINSCYTGDCGGLTGSVTVDITADLLNENSGADDLKFVITNGTNGFIDQLGLFYSGGLSGSPAIVSFTGTGGTGAPTLGLAACSTDNSGQGLNVCFDFPQPNGSRFDAGDSVTFFVDSNSAAYVAALFLTNGGFAHINEIGAGGRSAKITDGSRTVPEPVSLALLGSGLFAFAARRRRVMLSR
jgi:hypothetical protein